MGSTKAEAHTKHNAEQQLTPHNTPTKSFKQNHPLKKQPTFIKIGQQFSTRVDVLAPEFVKELEKLQDRVPPFDSATALSIVQAGLGAPADMVFAEFAREPIAAASLGQAHLARLSSGERVVVKVQRPGLKALFDIDLKNIRALAVWLQKVDPKTDGAARDWVAIYDECARTLYEEVRRLTGGRLLLRVGGGQRGKGGLEGGWAGWMI